MIKKSPRKKDYSLPISLALFATLLLVIVGTIFFQVRAHSLCANSISCISELTGKKQASNTGVFMGQKVQAPEMSDKPLFALDQTKTVLGDTTADNKHIYVDLTNQRLTAFEGSTKVFDFPVSTGKWGKTPTGDFRIWVWLRYTRMAGGNKALGTYYNLPNVPYTMYFSNDSVSKSEGYSIHGAYWHNNFGHPMSHGCVNMRIEDAGKIYYWTNPTAGNVSYPTADNPGTLITIYGTAPSE